MASSLLIGVNLAGAEFAPSKIPGTYNTDYTYPTHAEIDYYASKGMEVIRLPFLWERLQHSEFGALDSSELSRLDDVVNYATSKGLKVDLDPHNYGYGFGNLIGSAQTPNSAFADLWGKLAAHFASNPNVIFGLMNEPHDQPASTWLVSVNAAISAIRQAGATQEILVPGSYWDGAWTWTTTDNAAVIGAGVVDPDHNFAFEVHQYLDSDGSGTHSGVVSTTIGVERLTAITQWAEATGNHLFLGEVGVSTDQTSLTALDLMLTYMSQHVDAWQGVTYWAGGPWWGSYMYSIEPQNGADKPQMAILQSVLSASTTQFVSSGAVSSDAGVGSGNSLEVLSGGSALDTVVGSGGVQRVDSGGFAEGTDVQRGGFDDLFGSETAASIAGSATVEPGGHVDQTNVLSGGVVNVSGTSTALTLQSGAYAFVAGSAIGTIVSGGVEALTSGGAASNTLVSTGVEYVGSGAAANSATILNGGQENIAAGGIATGAIIHAGGVLLDAGVASGILLSGAGAYITSGGIASGTIVRGGAVIVEAGGVARGSILSGGGIEYIASGGSATGAIVGSGSQENIAAGGSASSATISSGGVLLDAGTLAFAVLSGGGAYILPGGRASGITVNGGADIVSSGGIATATQLIAGAEAVFGQTLLANVRNSGLEYVASGGVANTANVGSGGMMDVTAGGAASGTVVSSGGTLLVFGTASATVLSNGAGAYVESGGTTTGTVVQNGAADIVLVGAIARGTILGGVEVVSGVTTGALINSGGLEYVVSGGIARAALISGGTLELTSGGSTGSGAVTFAVSGGGTLQLDDSLHFNGLVAGFGQPDMLYLKDLTFSAGTTSASWTQSGTSGTLAVTNGTQTTDITLLGIYSTANFHVFSGGTGGTVVTDPPVVAQADLLANPHTT